MVRRLAGTNGFELLTACAMEDTRAPFVKIAQTKQGKQLRGKLRLPAEDLTAFLHDRAGLGFHYQLFCASSDRSSPLLEYTYVRRVKESWDLLAMLIRPPLPARFRTSASTAGRRGRRCSR